MPYPTANLGFTGHIYKSIDTTTTVVESRWVCFFSESFPICVVYVTKMSFVLLYIII